MKVKLLFALLIHSGILYSQSGNIIAKPLGRVVNGFVILDSNKVKGFNLKFSGYMTPFNPKTDYYSYEEAKVKLNITIRDGVIIRTLKKNVVINLETMELVATKKLRAPRFNADQLLRPSAIIVNGFAILDSAKANDFSDKFSAYIQEKKKYYNYEELDNESGALAGKRIVVCTLKENVIIDMEKLELINF